MEFSDYVRVLRRNWIIITASTLLGLIVACGATLTTSPIYSAKTDLFVSIQSSGSVTELQQGNTFTQARVQSYVETAKTPAVLQSVIEDLGLNETAAELGRRVSAQADLDTVIMTISAVDTSPAQAAAIAQSVADSLITVVGDLESPNSGELSPIKLSVITPAIAPTTPSSPNLELALAVGLLGGLIVGLGLAALRATTDTKVRGESDLMQATTTPVLGGIAYDSDAAKKPLLTQTRPQSPRAEAFRQIRTNLQFASVSSNSRTILVTSSLPGEGKSTTATNMAIAMSQAGQRVVLIDADLRRPMVSTYLGLEGSAGLTTALVGTTNVDNLLQPWGNEQLYVLTAGQIPPNPSELLGSLAMSDLLSHLEATFDVVIIDAPPLIPVTDATVLAQKVGGVILVAGAGRIKTQELKKALTTLDQVNANLFGVVLNLLPTKGPDAYAYSYYSYDSKVPSKAQGKTKRRGRPALTGSHMSPVQRGTGRSRPGNDAIDAKL